MIKQGRVLFIDMDKVHMPNEFVDKNMQTWKKNKPLKKLDPFDYGLTPKVAYPTPEDLRLAVEEYFLSCDGYRYYRGKLVYDVNNEPIVEQVQPYTLSGLARHLKLSVETLRKYEDYARSGLIPPEYAVIVIDAKLRIQEYAEKRLYDKDGASGARFVLESNFHWMIDKEKKELQQSKKRIQLTRDKLEFVKKQAEDNKLTDTELTVNILKAGDDL